MKKPLFPLVILFLLNTLLLFADTHSGYREYSEQTFEEASSQRRVLFFHASWCPNCRRADNQITENLDRIPLDLIIFKTDYDSYSDLKRKYAISYQHTFVQVDSEGNMITKWTGGDFESILENIK